LPELSEIQQAWGRRERQGGAWGKEGTLEVLAAVAVPSNDSCQRCVVVPWPGVQQERRQSAAGKGGILRGSHKPGLNNSGWFRFHKEKKAKRRQSLP